MKVAVIYASTTGNTEAMANAINESVKANGAETVFGTPDSANKDEVLDCDVILLGSPAMGDEVLEDSMEEFFSGIEGSLNGKKQEFLVLMTGVMVCGSETGQTD